MVREESNIRPAIVAGILWFVISLITSHIIGRSITETIMFGVASAILLAVIVYSLN